MKKGKVKNIDYILGGSFGAAAVFKVINVLNTIEYNTICQKYNITERAGSKYDFIILLILIILFIKYLKKIKVFL